MDDTEAGGVAGHVSQHPPRCQLFSRNKIDRGGSE